jgi:hypothetical protein
MLSGRPVGAPENGTVDMGGTVLNALTRRGWKSERASAVIGVESTTAAPLWSLPSSHRVSPPFERREIAQSSSAAAWA